MTNLCITALGKTEKMAGDGKKGGLSQVATLWNTATCKKQEKPKEKQKIKGFNLFRETSSKTASIDWGPGGAFGIGCGAGVGVGLTGGAGVGASPWSALRLVFGLGAGCGVGIGYGYGYGMGFRWDKPPKVVPKRVVIEL